jgi:hypothetical protein
VCIHMQGLKILVQAVTIFALYSEVTYGISDGKSAVLPEVLRAFLPSLQDSVANWSTIASTRRSGTSLCEFLHILLQKLVMYQCVLWIHSHASNQDNSVSTVTRPQAGGQRSRG